MVIREGEYRAEVVRAPGKDQVYVYRVYRGDGGEKLAEGREADANRAAVRASAVMSDLLHHDFECEQRLLQWAG
jgi:hypothetical protein